MFRAIGRVLLPIVRFGNRWIVLPIYSMIFMAKLRLEKTVVSARGLVFFVFTNRYVSHLLLFLIAVGTVGSQLMTQPASAQDAGQNSLLYTLVTHGQEDLIEESISPGLALADTHYLGTDTLQTTPGIDYDYDELGDDELVDLGISGTIAVRPQSDFPVAPSEEDVTPIEPPTTPSSPTAPRQGTETYTVRSGDTLATIASRFGVNVGTIQWANDMRGTSIRPGDTLRIPASSGVLYAIKRGDTVERLAQVYRVDAARIYSANNMTSRSTLSVGQEVLIPDATPQVAIAQQPTRTAPPTSRPTTATTPSTATPTTGSRTVRGVEVKANIPISTIRNKSFDIYQERANEAADTRSKPADADASTRSRLLWPTDLHVINQYYGYQHTGVDIDGDYTNAWYSAEAGVIEQAGWNNGGYGLMVVIDHGNGIKTRYAHASKLFVKAGDTVKRGQVIGMVGTTGRSTGTHLHFEVYVNNRRVNPLSYTR